MDLNRYALLDATSLSEAVRRGETTPAELAALALEAARSVNEGVNALAETYDEVPDDLESNRRPPLGAEAPFRGVPFLFKDAGATEAGRRQEFGSRLLRGRVVRESSYLAQRFLKAGLVPIGRSNVPEFTLSLSTESQLNGPTRNPWDPSRLAGGSSGGAAAAVAAGVVPVAHATDTAGSIRIPASACGLVGLKPSRGRISNGPQAGEPFMGMDTQFLVSRSVRDTAGLLDELSGAESGDPFLIASPARPYRKEVGAGVNPLRLALSVTPWGDYPVDPEVAAGTERVAAELAEMGHEVELATPQLNYDAFVEAALVGWSLGFDLALEDFARAMGRPLNTETLEPVTLRLYEQARELTAHQVARAETVFNRIRRDFGRFFERYDALVTPTLLQKPEPIGKYSQSVEHPDFESFFRLCDESGAYLPPFNLTGQPAISLPLLWSESGLPMGVQIVGRMADESLLLRLAALLEGSRPWAERRPPVHVVRG